MNSPILICDGCGLKNDVIEQLCGHNYCKQCVSNSELSGELICNLHLEQENEEEIDDFTILDEAICCHCDSVLDLDNAQDHYDNCDKRPIDCPKCEEKYPQGQMAIHIEKCERNVHQCLFSPLGCHYRGSPAEVEEHQNDIKIHFKLMTNSLINLQTQSELCEENRRDGDFSKSNECCSKHEDLQKQIEKQSVENDLYKQRIVQLELEQNKTALQLTEANEKMQVLIGKNQVAEDTCQEQPDNILSSSADETMQNLDLINEKLKLISVENNWNLKLEEVKTSIAKDIESTRNETQMAICKSSAETSQLLDLLHLKKGLAATYLENFNAKLNVVVSKQQDVTACNTFDFVWKLGKFSVKQAAAKENPNYAYYTAPFYNNPLGYKMRVSYYPNGWGVASDKYLSVYIQIGKGINDAFLKWPLSYKATFALIDPSDPKKHYAKRIEPPSGTETTGNFLSKPVGKYNSPLGLTNFISLDEMTDKYLQNDTICLQVSITLI